MRHFIIVAHTVPVDGQWGLDDLAGEAGRVDVVCRNISMALFTSHEIRSDTDVTVYFPLGPVAVRFRGAEVQRMNPDERSTAARIRNALRAAHPDPWWQLVEPGIEVAPFTLQDVLDDLNAPTVWLDRDGADAMVEPLPRDAAWVLSDHMPFSEEEARTVAAHSLFTVSMGGTWYHGHQVIGVVHFLLDRQGA